MSKEFEDRFHNYAKAVRDYCTKIKWDVINKEYIKQVIRPAVLLVLTILKLPMTLVRQTGK